MPPRIPERASKDSSEADTVRKARFFHAIDTRDRDRSIKDVYKEKEIPYATGRYWLHQRKILGSSAARRQGKYRKRSTRKFIDSILE